MHTSTIMRVPYGNFIRTVEIYRSLLTNSVNPPTVSFIHNVIRDGNYSGLRRKIIYSLREKSITARRNFSQLDPHGYYSSGYDLLIGPRKLNSALGRSNLKRVNDLHLRVQRTTAMDRRVHVYRNSIPRYYIAINRTIKRTQLQLCTIQWRVTTRRPLGTAYKSRYKAITNVDKEDISQGNLDRARCGRR